MQRYKGIPLHFALTPRSWPLQPLHQQNHGALASQSSRQPWHGLRPYGVPKSRLTSEPVDRCPYPRRPSKSPWRPTVAIKQPIEPLHWLIKGARYGDSQKKAPQSGGIGEPAEHLQLFVLPPLVSFLVIIWSTLWYTKLPGEICSCMPRKSASFVTRMPSKNPAKSAKSKRSYPNPGASAKRPEKESAPLLKRPKK